MIVNFLRSIPNVSVEVGHDDILVGYQGKTYWFEIKDPAKALNKDGSYKAGAVKESQWKLMQEFNGHYQIVCGVDPILETLGINH
jgi:hypothetical protein